MCNARSLDKNASNCTLLQILLCMCPCPACVRKISYDVWYAIDGAVVHEVWITYKCSLVVVNATRIGWDIRLESP
jgi:hypothetical protein